MKHKKTLKDCLECNGYSSIPHDIGLTDYCSVKNRFIKRTRRYCEKWKKYKKN